MNEEYKEMDTPSNQEDTVSPEVTETTEAVETEESKQLKSALAQKEHFRAKAEKAEADRKALEEKLKQGGGNKQLDVSDYIDISASLEGLDQREKEYLAREHKLSGKPLADIRKDENFELWQSAYRAKVEKEKLTLKPSGTQSETARPQTLQERLRAATVEEKEVILAENGLYKSPRPRNAVKIGRQG